MYKRIIVLALLVALASFAIVRADEMAQMPTSAPTPTPEEYAALERTWQPLNSSDEEECVGSTDNLLHNASFEGAYDSYTPPTPIDDCPWGICMSAQMADGWTPYWRSHDESDPSHIYRMPEWKAATTHFTDPPRVRSGERAQQWFTFFGTHEAGIYQQVENVTPGNNYCLSIWGHGWSSNGSAYTDPASHGFLNQQIGIDPTGGTDYTSPNIIWTSPRTQYDEYGLFKLTVPAQSDKLTVFFHSEPLWAWKHNDVYYDDAILVSVEEPAPATMTVAPATFSFSAETEFPITQTTNPIRVHFSPNYEGLEWTATVIPDGAFAPTLTTRSGDPTTTTQLSFSSAGLAAGSYTARIEFRSNSAETINDPGYVDIRLTVTQSPARFEMGATRTGGVVDKDAPQTLVATLPVSIKNWDAATWVAADDGAEWLTVLTNSGNNGDALRVALDSRGLDVGIYTATVTLTGQNATYSEQTQAVTVVLTVADEVSNVYLPILYR